MQGSLLSFALNDKRIEAVVEARDGDPSVKLENF